MKNLTAASSGIVRVAPDLAAVLSAIVMADPTVTVAAILDPLIRPELERRYAALPSHVRQTVESRAKKQRAAKEAAKV